MSASLVGSEMCIRDRESSPSPPDPANCRASLDAVQCTCTAGRRGDAPVSYTHLTLPTICSV
eukprot:3254455-Alexandrium_andersonii.AAC.1